MSDLEFVQQCVKGDRQAWDEFVTRYSRLIYSYIYRVLRLKGAPENVQNNAADIFQEIFVSLSQDNFRKLKSFKAKNNCTLASWLRQVTIHAVIDYLRRLKGTISLDEEDADGTSLQDIVADDAPSARDELKAQEKLIDLKDCVEKLGTQDKFFLELHFNRALSLQKLAEFWRASRPAMDMRKARIISRLRDCFKAKGFEIT
ncbi:MAG TPA: sigma-70 family RNA polymerase sigma factor [Patescibacteria group bacterium]|nr:sigma-70 family RNA polymerase sigma factor [Patescibacteria group bacterium]